MNEKIPPHKSPEVVELTTEQKLDLITRITQIDYFHYARLIIGETTCRFSFGDEYTRQAMIQFLAGAAKEHLIQSVINGLITDYDQITDVVRDFMTDKADFKQ